nr:Rz1 family lipoprotein [Klebsiella oxytoca]
MRKKPLSVCIAMSLLAVSGCSSTPDAPRTERPAPAAWAMLPAPDLMTPLNGIISPSESESSPSPGK